MYCDVCGDREVRVFVVKPRPSDPMELVCIMGYCPKCTITPPLMTVPEVGLALALHECVAATSSVLDDYMESEYARRNHHAFLTL